MGRKTWVFPDAEMPPPGDSLLKGHEGVIVLNTGEYKAATLVITFYFTETAPATSMPIIVEPERVRCVRLDRETDVGFRIPLEEQYAFKVESDVPVVLQYGRLDARQTNLAYYTTMGYSVS
ncbi:MAG: sensory rhodopsin transducer [Alkalispirochaeta sp.]